MREIQTYVKGGEKEKKERRERRERDRDRDATAQLWFKLVPGIKLGNSEPQA